tara:strand:+ start:245 stop:2524 length:2280 start_codon:yes stop_codon:yes gene_type:complete
MSEYSSISKRRLKNRSLIRVVYFFPIQLLLLHFKRNHILLFFWLLLFLYVTGNFGSGFGIDTLFLAPIYLGDTSFLSFLIVGFSLGGLIMSFHIYSYILFSRDFKFLATLSRPFLKFCLNNMLIPFGFITLYVIMIFNFLTEEEIMSIVDVLLCILALFIGLISFYLLSILYFVKFNKNVYVISGKTETYYDDLGKSKVKESNFINKKKNTTVNIDKKTWHVETYMSGIFSINLARSTKHYEKGLIEKVFAQNHINASYFEIVLILSFIVIGLFRDTNWLNIPAGASIFLLFTLLIMLFSVFYSWFKGWTLTMLIVGVLGFNYLSNHSHWFQFKNYAYGLSYQQDVDYNHQKIKQINQSQQRLKTSNQNTIQILENWKIKNQPLKKPKIIFVNTSGGGLRSALWTVHVLNHLDSITNDQFFKRTHLITGASGGMIGAGFYREYFLEKSEEKINLSSKELRKRVSSDLLNPLAFSIATTDMFFRFKKFDDGKYEYTKDRGWFFEKILINNFGLCRDKRLKDYVLPELSSKIPMMIFAPCTVNDGRRVLISSQPISFLCHNDTSILNENPSFENVEYNALFADNDPLNLRFSSALRMNATFPYVLPMVLLPTTPKTWVMDAGVRDNFGLSTSLNYIDKFKHWINNNTSGIVVVQIRDREKNSATKNKNTGSLLSKLFTPLTNVYSNFLKIQDYKNDYLLDNLSDSFDGEIDYIEIALGELSSDEISMSWHLTSRDKKRIYQQINSEENRKAIHKIEQLFLN